MFPYNEVLNPVLTAMPPSGIRRFFDLAATMKDVISLGVGEPDFKTPLAVRNAAIEVLEQGNTKYTSNAGLEQLRVAIGSYLERRFDLRYDPKSEILVTVGGSEAIDLAIRTVVSPGDEVLVVTPSFVCYTPIVNMSGGVAVELATREEDCFKLTPDALEQAITDKTKLLILPFPSNPTGAILTREELEALAAVIRRHKLLVLSDEIYCELTYGGERHVSIANIEGMWERSIVVNGFSKSYSMTGWRLGYACAPKPILEQMLKLHQYAIMCAPTVSQTAAIVALTDCDEDIRLMREEYDYRRKLLVNAFNEMGLRCFEPMGAFYVFPNIRSTGLTSEEFCTGLLERKQVAVVPGSAFGKGGEGHIRVSYSYSREHLQTALERIKEFIAEQSK